MKQIKFLLIPFVAIICFLPLNAQNAQDAQTNGLSAVDIEAFKERTGQMIEELQNNLSVLGSKEKSNETKQVYKEQTLKLFMGEGDAYKDTTYGNEHPAVHMQVSVLRNGIETKSNIPLKKYLSNLIRLRYAKVKITQAETYRLSNLYKVGDHYEAVATIFQKFCGYDLDGKMKYCDVTKKTIHIYIVPGEDWEGKFWDIKFGDIDVVETTGI
jgi:hypothetical protein